MVLCSFNFILHSCITIHVLLFCQTLCDLCQTVLLHLLTIKQFVLLPVKYNISPDVFHSMYIVVNVIKLNQILLIHVCLLNELTNNIKMLISFCFVFSLNSFQYFLLFLCVLSFVLFGWFILKEIFFDLKFILVMLIMFNSQYLTQYDNKGYSSLCYVPAY